MIPIEPRNLALGNRLAVPVLEDAPVAGRMDNLVGRVEHDGRKVRQLDHAHGTLLL